MLTFVATYVTDKSLLCEHGVSYISPAYLSIVIFGFKEPLKGQNDKNIKASNFILSACILFFSPLVKHFPNLNVFWGNLI